MSAIAPVRGKKKETQAETSPLIRPEANPALAGSSLWISNTVTGKLQLIAAPAKAIVSQDQTPVLR